jgi:hypothetical protein
MATAVRSTIEAYLGRRELFAVVPFTQNSELNSLERKLQKKRAIIV